MQREISNRKQLGLFLFLGLILVPLVGIAASVAGPSEKPNRQSTMPAKIGMVLFFCTAGAAITAYAICRCPSRITFAENITIHYLFRRRTISRQELQAVSVADRSSPLGHGVGQMAAEDSGVCLKLADGTLVKWAMPRRAAANFRGAFLRWMESESA